LSGRRPTNIVLNVPGKKFREKFRTATKSPGHPLTKKVPDTHKPSIFQYLSYVLTAAKANILQKQAVFAKLAKKIWVSMLYPSMLHPEDKQHL
jgi:hypothetical protein